MFIPGLISMLLALTPTLWNPSIWQMWLEVMVMSSGGIFTFDSFGWGNGVKDRCMTRDETQVAISTVDSAVSGLYGPGTYLAWLITSWAAAISSIAHAKCASNNPQKLELDLELVAVILYPIIAALDIIVRLIRCKIDPSMVASTSVIFSSLTIFGPATRLSLQREGSEIFEALDDMSKFFENRRLLTMMIPRWICHAVAIAILAEPYSNLDLVITTYVLLFVVVVYSGVVGEERFLKGKFSQQYRPYQERVAFFCIVQLVFSIMLMTTGNRSLWPATSASLFDLDQATALFCAIVNLIFSRRTYFRTILARGSRKLLTFRRSGAFDRELRVEGGHDIVPLSDVAND